MSKFYVPTAIPYVNAVPHIGNAMDLIIADAIARYHRNIGDSVLFSTGTDEHGAKILEKAKEAGQDPQAFTDTMSQNFINLCKVLNVRYDRFVRTTEPGHITSARHFWQQIEKDIYKGKYKGWYCVGCEKYVTDTEAKANKGVCPIHNRKYEELEEENYFFKLSKYTKPLKELIEKDELKIYHKARKNEILDILNSGLEDVSFSRPKEKIPWGVDVPGDESQVMYVWTEALLNYLTVTGYPQKGYEQWWPSDVQVIGKDILRFHAAIWPAMLLSAGLPLPKALYVHGFINVGGKKMSKTVGNVVDPFEVVKKYGADAFRYYLLAEIPGDDDGDFTWERFQAVYNSDLANDLGNLVQRVASMVNKYQNNVVGDIPEHSHDMTAYQEAIQNYRFDLAAGEVKELVRGLNQYIEEEKPWKLAKDDTKHLQEVLAYLVSNILQVAFLLDPFMPATSEKIKQTFADGLVREISSLFPKHDELVAGHGTVK